MTFSDHTENIDQYYSDLSILKINQIYRWDTAKFIFKVDKGVVPDNFIDFLPKINHTYNTRSKAKMQFKLSSPQTEIGKLSVKFFGVKLWATLPTHLKEITDAKAFSKEYKKELLEEK